MTFKLLDLFSGIGGFSLGLERSGAFQTVAFCEIEPFPRRVLAQHWPKVPIYDDVRTLSAARLAADGIEVDAICGGFPCQDVSLAGRRAGLDGARSGLWAEFRRLIGELRPRVVIVENTLGLLSAGMETVLGDLAALRYDAEWHCIPASAVGARHARDRVWIVANPSSERLEVDTGALWGQAAAKLLADSNKEWTPEPDVRRVAYGLPGRLDRLRALGNAVVPQVAELIGNSIARAA
ncbi:hypothetical protein AMST5_01440 [freshwater sediment metagenome]|uniref:DNA (cytosine-5-)-methyltransferase n=1 Tax=freshwater sediment metagenome TaxID=556182 RepID=A0AA48RCN1_9ZZZZ